MLTNTSALIIAGFYRELVDEDLPTDLVITLTVEAARIILSDGVCVSPSTLLQDAE